MKTEQVDIETEQTREQYACRASYFWRGNSEAERDDGRMLSRGTDRREERKGKLERDGERQHRDIIPQPLASEAAAE
jgi:hypothetical protein